MIKNQIVIICLMAMDIDNRRSDLDYLCMAMITKMIDAEIVPGVFHDHKK